MDGSDAQIGSKQLNRFYSALVVNYGVPFVSKLRNSGEL